MIDFILAIIFLLFINTTFLYHKSFLVFYFYVYKHFINFKDYLAATISDRLSADGQNDKRSDVVYDI